MLPVMLHKQSNTTMPIGLLTSTQFFYRYPARKCMWPIRGQSDMGKVSS